MKLVYICSPLKGDYKNNIKKACGYCRDAIGFGVIPIAPHIYFTQFLNDFDTYERALGMMAGLKLLEECSEIWVYGIHNPSEGMEAEIKRAKDLCIPVISADAVYKNMRDGVV